MFLHIYYIKTRTLSQETAVSLWVHVGSQRRCLCTGMARRSFLDYACPLFWICWGKCVKETCTAPLVDEGRNAGSFYTRIYSAGLGLAKEQIPILARGGDYRGA